MKQRHGFEHDRLGFKELSFFAIGRWRLVLIGAIGLLCLALMAWLRIPREDEPRIEVQGLSVTLLYPGASPEDVENQVVKPVEEVLYEMPGLLWVESQALPNAALFNLKFEDTVAMEVAVEKVRGKVMGKKRDLPAEVKDPEVVHWTTSTTPQMVLAVTGQLSDESLSAQARRIKKVLTALPGISGVDLKGEHKSAVRIRLDPVKLAHHRITADQVVRQLQLSNVRIPGGELHVGNLSALLQVNQEIINADQWARVPISARGEENGSTQTLPLGAVAEVREETLTANRRFLWNSQPAVGLELRFRAGENGVETGKTVRDSLKSLENTLPQGAKIVICHDQPQWTAQTIRDFITSLLEGMALVLLVITLGMGWRSALVVSGVIPLASGGAILGLWALGFSLEQVTIGGLIVALGLLVDDAVVVTESVQIMRDKGLSSVRAAVYGTARVFWANNGTTAVAVASFLPLFAMSGDTGAYIKGLPTAVILALGTSLLVAQVFTPWVSTFFLQKPKASLDIPDDQIYDRTEDRSDEGEKGERNPVLLWLRHRYARHIPWVVSHPARVVLVATLLLVGSTLLFPVIGFQFFPKADKNALFVSLELPKGGRLEATQAKLQSALTLLQGDEGVVDTSSTLGTSYPLIFSSRLGKGEGSHVAEILVRLKEGQDSGQAAMRLRRKLSDLTGVNISVEELIYGPPITHPVLVRIYGEDYAKLRGLAEELKAKLRSIPGTINVADSLTEAMPTATVKMDPDRALRRGLTPAQIGQSLRWLYGEDKITEFQRGEETVQVVLEAQPQPDRPLASLGETPIPSATGAAVPLKDSSQVQLDYGFTRLDRRNARRMVVVYADVDANTLASKVVDQVDPWLRSRNWEPGYGFSYAGEQEETVASFQKLGVAAVGAILLIALLLLLMFDSLMLTFLVMLAVPFALIGALPGLALTGNPFGFMAFLGLIALIGVYVNHKIYFVDRMLELMRRGEDVGQAILHAGQDRLRPVVLTALTAVLGLLPLTLGGGAMWGAFGWVNIFGLVASIPLSLVLLPAFIALAYRISGRWKPSGGFETPTIVNK